MENLSTIISLVLALSLSAERLVEIIKGLIGSSLNVKGVDEKVEAERKAKVAGLAVVCGIATSSLFYFSVPDNGIINNWTSAIAYGVLASGGSAFWNSILSYILGVKDLKAKEVEEKALENKNKVLANVILSEITVNKSLSNELKISIVKDNLNRTFADSLSKVSLSSVS